MKILEFDIIRGIYHFEMNELSTAFHLHPVIEIIHCPNGTFNLETDTYSYTNISFAIIKPNVSHRIFSVSSEIELFMVECYDVSHFFEMLDGQKIEVDTRDDKIFSINIYTENLLPKVISVCKESNLRKVYDSRVAKCLEILDSELLDYREMMTKITDEIPLSPSRISHLFKDTVGISLKKYLLWARTKRAMQLFLEGRNLTETAHQHGFFDQAHLTRSFSRFFGVVPSKKYNSRIIQF